MRAGFGYDVHAFDENRTLVIGGLQIDDSPGLSGHSDGDVLSHAVADALLGAAGLGDIGSHFGQETFPPGGSSTGILEGVAKMIADKGFELGNLDVTVVLQRVPISGHREAIERSIASALGADLAKVNVKATTTDGLGFSGRGEGAAAYAVATLLPRL